MKKYKIIVYVILFILLISMQFMSSLNRIVLYAKHFSIFLFLVLISYDLVTTITKFFITEYRLTGLKETIVHVGRVTTFTILILTISHSQYNYIKLKEIPYTLGCKYYDRYNNLIYQGHFAFSCPDLTIIENDEDKLVFSVTEMDELIGYDKYPTGENNYIPNPTVNSERLTSVSIKYNEQDKINSVSYQVSIKTHVTSVGYDDFVEYFSHHKMIENNYNDSSFEQFVLTAHGFYNPNTYDLSHPSFEASDYEKMRYYTVIGNEATDQTLYHLIKEEISINGETLTEDVATIDYTIHSDQVSSYSIEVHDKYVMIESKIIDLVLRERDITYSINKLDTSGNVKQLNSIYESYLDYGHVMTSNQTTVEKEDDTVDRTIKNYKLVNDLDDHIYLVTKPDKVFDTIRDNFSKEVGTIYLIEKTSYGNRVAYMAHKSQDYQNFSYNGESGIESYFLYHYQWNSHLNMLFDLKYQLNSQGDHILYSELPILLFE